MAVTTPTTWETCTRLQIQPDEPITAGASGDVEELELINDQITRNFTSSTGQVAGLTCHRDSISAGAAKGVPDLTASYSTLSIGKMRVWGDAAKFILRAKGKSCNVKVTIGGSVTIGPLALSITDQWYSTSATAITGATIDADGFVTVKLEAEYTSSSYILEQITIDEEEVASGSLPDYSAPSEQGFYPLHSDPFDPDGPMDAWMLQTMDDMAGRLMIERARRFLHMTNNKLRHKLSSVFWRLDGPYMLPVPPGCTSATVIVSGAPLSGLDVNLCVLSEHERFDKVMPERKITTSGTSTAHNKFDGIKVVSNRSGDRINLIWIAFKSEIGGVQVSGVEVGHHDMNKPWKLYCENSLGSYSPDSFNVCGVVGVDDGLFVGKSNHYTGSPQSYFDIACVIGEENAVTSSGDNVRQPISISPSPHTGITGASDFGRVRSEARRADTYIPSLDVYAIGRFRVLGLYLEAVPDAFERRKLAWPTNPPSAGLIGEISERVNQMSRYLTPMIFTRHYGARNHINETGTGSNHILPNGHYIFVPSSGTAATFNVEVPIAADPNHGSSTGLVSSKVYAQAVYMVIARRTSTLGGDGKVAFFFSGESESVARPPLELHAGGRENVSPTVADASIAGTPDGSAEKFGTSPTETTEWAYHCQYTWHTEGYRHSSPWHLSPRFEVDLPGAFPTTLTISLKNYGGATDYELIGRVHTTMVVAGLCVWIGPRE